MNNIIKNVSIFVGGIAVGCGGTLAALRIYAKRHQEDSEIEIEIEECDSNEEVEEEEEDDEDDSSNIINETYIDSFKREDSKSYTDVAKEYAPGMNENEEEPIVESKYEVEGSGYVINPDEFGNRDYDMITLEYYSDDVLADENMVPVDNISGLFSYKAITHLRKFVNSTLSCVYIRNDEMQADYEVMLRDCEFSEVATRE